jgi:hypothetical protein
VVAKNFKPNPIRAFEHLPLSAFAELQVKGELRRSLSRGPGLGFDRHRGKACLLSGLQLTLANVDTPDGAVREAEPSADLSVGEPSPCHSADFKNLFWQ